MSTQFNFDLPSLAAPHVPALSIEAWVEPTSVDSNHRGIVAIEGPASVGHQGVRLYVWRRDDGARITFGFVNGTSSFDVDIPFPDDRAYHHAAGTFDGRKTLCLYIDGEPRCTVGGVPSVVGRVLIGRIGGRGRPNEGFIGIIADVAFYDRALSEARIRAHVRAAGLPRNG